MIKEHKFQKGQNQIVNSFQDANQATTNPCNYTDEKIYILNRFDDKFLYEKYGSRLTSRPRTIDGSSLQTIKFSPNNSKN